MKAQSKRYSSLSSHHHHQPHVKTRFHLYVFCTTFDAYDIMVGDKDGYVFQKVFLLEKQSSSSQFC